MKPQKTPRRQAWRKGLIFGSFLLFPITIYYFSPVIIVNAARLGVINGSFLVFGLLFISSLFLGRAWCGWLCPGAGLGEAAVMARNRPAPGGRLDWIKYALWLPWVGSIVWLAYSAGGYSKVDPWFMISGGVSLRGPESYVVYFSFVALIAVLAWFPGRRGFCHYVCWMAPFMVIGNALGRKCALPALTITADAAKCLDCGTCSENCPMSLPVGDLVKRGDMHHNECILCGTCVDGCQQKAISFSWGKRG